MSDVRAVIERAADEWLGRHGVVEIWEDVRDGEVVVVFGVLDVDAATRNVPARIDGVRVVFEQRDRPIPYTSS